MCFACSEDNATPAETFDSGRRIGPTDERPRDDKGVIVLTDDMGMPGASCQDGEGGPAQKAAEVGLYKRCLGWRMWASPERCNGIDDDCDDA